MSVSFGSDGSMTAEFTGGVPAIGSVYPVSAASALPASSTVGQIVSITDFGFPYVQVQWTGSVWKQITHFYTTWAALPSATTFLGFVGYVTDFFGGFRVIARAAAGSNYWRPFNPVKLISYVTGDPATTLGPNNPVVDYVLMPNVALPNPGFILVGDLIELDCFMLRGGTLASNSPVVSLRMGTDAIPVNNLVVAGAGLGGATNVSLRSNHKVTITATTKTVSLGTLTPGVTAGSTLTTRTITDITTANQFASLTIKSGGTEETMTPYAVEATLFPNA